MKASFSWLKSYVSIEMSPSDLADALTMAGLEVEALTDRYAYLDTVIVGQIVEINRHPDADKLKVCTVNTGDCRLPVVCGAPNIEKDMLAPLALPGTLFPGGTILQTNLIRGQTSEGMLCSEGELGLGPDISGIMTLPKNVDIGEKLPNALSLSDPVLEIDLTPNRPDCLSILGIAREIAAIQKTSLKYPVIKLSPCEDDITRYASVTIEDPDHCPRYAARLLTDITVDSSPFWLQERLNSVGLRPINNIVDITNFVMMEMGQPLHAFDFDRLAENRIVVRLAMEGERFSTLDEKERSLASHILMICDGEKPVAIGGVMGGLNSEIEPSTRRVLIESACFNPASIRRTSKRLGLGTDASHRFERGVDPEGTRTALDRAAQLMAEIGGGTLMEGVIDEYPQKALLNKVRLSVSETNRFLGTDLSLSTMEDLLGSIEFSVQRDDEDTLVVVPPSFRVDVKRPVDLMEEIARLSGYNAIPTTLPSISAGTKLPSKEMDLRDKIKQLMTGFGFTETINYSFMNKFSCDQLCLPSDDPRRRLVEILNPLTEEQTVMRTSMIPGMLGAMHRNAAQQIRNLRLFESGKIYIDKNREELPEEIEMLTGLWTGARSPASWHSKETACDFYDMKGIIDGLFSALKVSVPRFAKMPNDACHYTRPGYTAEIFTEDLSVGLVGEIRTEVLSSFDLAQETYIFELDLNRLSPHIPDIYKVKPISKFPAVSRDITIIVDQGIESGKILERVTQFKEKLVESLHLFSVFGGHPIPSGKMSVSFRITYRSVEETLQDETINRLHKEITDRLVKAFHAMLPA